MSRKNLTYNTIFDDNNLIDNHNNISSPELDAIINSSENASINSFSTIHDQLQHLLKEMNKKSMRKNNNLVSSSEKNSVFGNKIVSPISSKVTSSMTSITNNCDLDLIIKKIDALTAAIEKEREFYKAKFEDLSSKLERLERLVANEREQSVSYLYKDRRSSNVNLKTTPNNWQEALENLFIDNSVVKIAKYSSARSPLDSNAIKRVIKRTI